MPNRGAARGVMRVGMLALLCWVAPACGSDGSGGEGAAGSVSGAAAGRGNALGGATSATGGAPVGPGGAPLGTGGASNSGGAPAASGGAGAGGIPSTGGAPATGGTQATGGAEATGGIQATGGAEATGGIQATGGAEATGGIQVTGGAEATGGIQATGGAPPVTDITVSSFSVDSSVTAGDTVGASVTLTNQGTAPHTILEVVITARQPPAYTAPPYLDFGPRLPSVTLEPGESVTLAASYTVDAGAAPGTYQAFATYRDADGWHDQPLVTFEVLPAGGTGGSGGTSSTGGQPSTGGTSSGCSATTTPVARHGQLRIDQGQLVNECGRPIQFASMSMYDWSQQGRQFYNATAVRNLAGTGQGQKRNTTLRIPLLARNWPDAYPRIQRVMDACIANGIYCIPNWHVIGGSDVNAAKAFYVQLARDYGNTPNIIYEPWNEPTTQSWSQIKAYMEEILSAVRTIDPDGIFLAGTRQWCQRPDEACANPIDDPYVGYVFHFYANSHSLSSFRGNIDRCLNANQLVWTTEYGGVSANGDGTFNVTEANRWWDYMDQHLISSNNWAIETNTETSSVFTTDASATGPWPDSQITNSGRNVFAYIADRYPITMSQ